MLNRRILRIKAFKAIYSLAENPSMTEKEMIAQLDRSCESSADLYLFLLALVQSLTDEARSRIEVARAKFHPTAEELSPNMKFAENALAPLLSQDPDFSKIISRKKLSWDQYDVFLRRLFDSVKASESYRRYMDDPERSVRADADLFAVIFSDFLPDNKDLEDILEDLSIWWNDDLEYVINHCCTSLDVLGDGGRWSMPELYMSEMSGRSGMEDDRAFVHTLVRKAHSCFEKYYQMIADSTPKWDKSRICTTDLALIVAGLSESAAFPQTDSRIIINEYVEISKFYSTPESRAFVNGLLDKLINKK